MALTDEEATARFAELTADQQRCLLALGELVKEKNGERARPGEAVTARTIADRCGWDLPKTHDVLCQLQSLGLVGKGAPN